MHAVTRHVDPAHEAAVLCPDDKDAKVRERVREATAAVGAAHDCSGSAIAAADVDDDIVRDDVCAGDVAEGVGGLAKDEKTGAWSASAAGVNGGGRWFVWGGGGRIKANGERKGGGGGVRGGGGGGCGGGGGGGGR